MERFDLRLYVAGRNPQTQQAIECVTRFCGTELRGHYNLEVIDVLEHPKNEGVEQILATPTLVKYAPGPRCQIVGDLSDRDTVRLGLGISRPAEMDST